MELIDQKADLIYGDAINIGISGSAIWRYGKCAPLKFENLFLYDTSGNLIDRYKKSMIN